MRTSSSIAAIGIAAALLIAIGAATASAQAISDRGNVAAEARANTNRLVTNLATGTFEVRLTPLSSEEIERGTPLGRMSIDKQFHGDLEGTSRGEMLTAVTPMDGSAGYVALERVDGRLSGRRGTFVLQHSGTMTRGDGRLTITVVPDSGTGELEGLAGSMAIEIADGKHSYEFEYSLPEPRGPEGDH